MRTFARIAVRQNGEEGDLILGKTFGALRGGKVYEIVDPLGIGNVADFIVREVGDSCINGFLSERPDGPMLSWAHEMERIVNEGLHLYSKQEWDKLCGKEQE